MTSDDIYGPFDALVLLVGERQATEIAVKGECSVRLALVTMNTNIERVTMTDEYDDEMDSSDFGH